jgi:CheY-like chemotaxis protein
MSWILVAQPDPRQAAVLQEALRARVPADVVFVESLDEAFDWIDEAVPDVILLPMLTPAFVEDYLLAYLATRPNAGHVQILGIPQLATTEPAPPPPSRSFFSWRRRVVLPPVVRPGRDPLAFTQDLIEYLACARAVRKELDLYGVSVTLAETLERRREPRFPVHEVPWISLVSFAGAGASLIDVSARGALLRTHVRPAHRSLKRSDTDVRSRPRLVLKLESHSEVHAPGQIIRCMPVAQNDRTQYEIAFSFDEAVGLHLPWSGELVPSLSAPRALPKQVLGATKINRPEYLLLPA